MSTIEKEAPSTHSTSKGLEKEIQATSRFNRRSKVTAIASVAAVAATAGIAIGLHRGEQTGRASRNNEVSSLETKLKNSEQVRNTQDWLLDRGITPVDNDGIALDQNNGNVYVRMQPAVCKEPVSLSFNGEALTLKQPDAEGRNYGELVMKNAIEVDAVLKDICT